MKTQNTYWPRERRVKALIVVRRREEQTAGARSDAVERVEQPREREGVRVLGRHRSDCGCWCDYGGWCTGGLLIARDGFRKRRVEI
jgi:hypothetical protein